MVDTGIKALRKIQIGLENPPGTAVAATTKWRGLGTIQNNIEPVFVQEDVGLLVPTERSYIPFKLAQIDFEPIEATFEQLPYIFAAGIEGIVTGQADGLGSGKIYQYDPPLESVGSIKTFTIEGGDNIQAQEMEYGFITEFKLAGAQKEALKMSGTWNGRQVVNTTFTPSLSLPTVEEILASKGKLFIDPAAGPIGTTQVSNTLLDMALSWKTGWIAVWTGEGELYFTFIKPSHPEITLDLTFEHNASAVEEISAWNNQTTKLIQLLYEGSALGTPGTEYTYKSAIVNLAGKWSKFGKIGERDGNDIVAGTFRASYNSTYGQIGQMIVVNELASLP